MSRYARQIMVPEFGTSGQEAIENTHFLVVGAGGLAATVLPLLAGAGAQKLTIVDDDRVSMSNLHRQTLFGEADVGAFKADVAAQRCGAQNSNVAFDVVLEKLTPENATDLVRAADIILDCADSYAVSYCLSDVCFELGKPFVTASVLGLTGYVGGFCAGAPSLRAVFPDAPENTASCATAGVLNTTVSMVGTLQAHLAISAALGSTNDALGKLVQVDIGSMKTSSFRFDNASEPEVKFEFVAASQLSAGDTIFDLRDDVEAPEMLHPSAVRGTAESITPPDTGRLALCCATGLRAWRTAQTLSDNWSGEIVLVAASAS